MSAKLRLFILRLTLGHLLQTKHKLHNGRLALLACWYLISVLLLTKLASLVGFEPTTIGSKNRGSTVELQQMVNLVRIELTSITEVTA